MLTIDCTDVQSIKQELVVYVSDQVAAIPALKQTEFVLSTIDDSPIDTNVVITSIKEFLDSIDEGHNFAVIANNDVIMIKSISGKVIERDATPPPPQMFSCSHCGFVTQYEVEYNTHRKIHYL